MKRIYKCFTVLLVCCLTLFDAQAQQKITGVILDATDNQPLPGVSVFIKGTASGTTTDSEGKFSITAKEGDILTFSFVGFTSQEIVVGNQTTIDLKLGADTKLLSEIVVVGYGTERKQDISGSIASVSAEDIKSLPITSFEQGLQGRVPGVQVMQGNSAPGGAPQVRIRGANTVLGGNEPLYVIDGVPVYNSELENSGGLNIGTQPSNALATINPNDIVSMEILKDASATAIYGARGSNGVVIITTKRGKADTGKVTFEAYYGVQEISKKLKLMNAQDYVKIINERAANTGTALTFPDPSIYTNSTDWQDFFFKRAPMANYSLNFSGGSQRSQYSVSGNWFSQDGIMLTSDFSRGSIRVNLDNQVTEKLKLSTSIMASRSVTNRPLNFPLSNALSFAPVLSPYDVNGNFSNLNTITLIGGDNPVEGLLKSSDRLAADRFLGNIFAEYTILDGLTISARLASDILNQHNDIYIKKGSFVNPAPGAVVKDNAGTNSIIEYLINYNRIFKGIHKLNATIGYTWQENINTFFQQSGTGFQFDDFGTYNMGAAAVTNPNVSYKNKSVILSYLSRFNYVLKDKYIITLTGRLDGSSRFGPNNKWGFFPSGALAWRVSQEDFMKGITFIDDLKLRTSYGKTGNQEIGLYNSISRLRPAIGVIGSPLAAFIGYVPVTLANEDLKWETNTQFDAGVDLSFLKNRITVTADYYTKRTDDLLANLPIPGSSGFSSILINSGVLENKGFELGLNSTLIQSKGVTWKLGGNISQNSTKVLKLAVSTGEFFAPSIPSPLDRPVNIVKEGEALSSFWGYKEDGLTADGDIKYQDLTGDGIVDGKDQTILGSPFPNLIYGFNTSINYKNFTLTVFLQGVSGSKVFNSNDFLIANSATRISNQLEDVNNRWTVDNPNPNAKYPRASNRQLLVSDRFVQNADYLRLRNIMISYDVPASKLGVKWLESARIYLSAQNLLTFTDYNGYDPEVSQTGSNSLVKGLDRGSYPANRTFTVGCNITLK